ncbi:hypothetical protein OIU78_001536 [Salix suchowensis]|nr:hypothetical protein OIU78_001536 [Salix suchowensis]
MMMRIPPKFAKHLVNLPGILRGNAEFDVTIYGKDGCEKNVVAATEKKTEPYSCVGKQNEVDQPVGKDQKHGTNIETIDIEPDISMTKLNDQQQPQCQKGSSNTTSSQWDIEHNYFDFPDIADLYKETCLEMTRHQNSVPYSSSLSS